MSYPEIELLGVQSSFDEMSEVEKIVENTIEIAPDLAGIFVVSGGQAGVCKAMQNLNMETRPYVIGYDVTPTNIKALKEGTYDFLIDQEKNFQDKYNWGDSEEIWDDTEQLPEEMDEPDEMEEQLDIEKQCE